ncbi:MAG TPA: M36 family metallopeptidase, partial [Actinomycetota bacterium]|nr:M36 family metallopeptidase [Actinomycetota bacterium]
AHEFGHMVEDRMIGKGNRRSGFHAGAMGESVTDLMAMEYLNEYSFVTGGVERYAVGAYVTGNPVEAIRNYNMSWQSAGRFPQEARDHDTNPLNFSGIGYDIVGPQVHATGEIWSATNFDLRSLLNQRYGSGNPNVQRQCADGELPATSCPGNRRWIQLMFDSFLLQPIAPTMLDARDAMLATDVMRFGGANQDLLWLGFARRGFGSAASVVSENDVLPVPSWESPHHDEATLTFEAFAKDEGGAAITDFDVFVGDYEARSVPIDTSEAFVPGPQRGYNFVAVAPGYGHVRFAVRNLLPNESRTISIHFPTNWASQSKGATASGDGANFGDLIDDAEGTTWESTSGAVEGKQVVIALDGEQSFDLAKASALLEPGQNRFTALRQFELQTCTAGGPENPSCDGSVSEGWTSVLVSDSAAFPGINPRPVGPELQLRAFDVDGSASATHVKFIVLNNQCTGQPSFQGEQDQDPGNATDCRGTVVAEQVRAAELQLLSSEAAVDGAYMAE